MLPTGYKISVIMPAYNAASYIRQAAESVLQQSHKNLELIVVDDGSSDGTAGIVRSMAAEDNRVILIEQKNSGKPSIARNRGIARATGRYLSFLDSDDYWLPERIAKLLEGLESHPDWLAVFHDLQLVTQEGRPLAGTYLGNASFLEAASPYLTPLGLQWYECSNRFFTFMSLRYTAVHTQSIMIDRERFNASTLRFNENFTICEDTDLWIQLAMNGKLGYLDKSLSCYRQHPASITKNELLLYQQVVNFHEYNYERVARHMDKSQRTSYLNKINRCIRDMAYQSYRAGFPSKARALSMGIFMAQPRMSDLVLSAKTLIPPVLQAAIRKYRVERVVN